MRALNLVAARAPAPSRCRYKGGQMRRLIFAALLELAACAHPQAKPNTRSPQSDEVSKWGTGFQIKALRGVSPTEMKLTCLAGTGIECSAQQPIVVPENLGPLLGGWCDERDEERVAAAITFRCGAQLKANGWDVSTLKTEPSMLVPVQ